MNDMDKFAFKVTVASRPAVNSTIATKDVLSSYLAESLGLIPDRGKGIVAVKLLQLFSEISGKREVNLVVADKKFPVKNGGMRVEDIHKWLQASDVQIGIAQLYNTYITNFIKANLIVKKKYSMYGLKAPSLQDSLRDVAREVQKEISVIVDHGKMLDDMVRKE